MVGCEQGQRLTVIWVDRNRSFQQVLRGDAVRPRDPPVMRQRAHHEIPRIHAVGRFAPASEIFRGVNLRFYCRDNGVRDLVLDGEYVGQVAVEMFGPEVAAGGGVVELRRDAHAVAVPSHAAFEHVAYPELRGDLLQVHRFALVGEGRVAGDHEEPAQFRQRGDDVLADSVGEILLFPVAAHVVERQHGNRRPVGQR